MSNVPNLYFDGQLIDVQWGNEKIVAEWFAKYFGWSIQRQEQWKVDPRCEDGQMTQMEWGTWIISYIAMEQLSHHYAARSGADGNIRLCFRIKELQAKHHLFQQAGIQVTPIYNGAGPTTYFDFWVPGEGFRLTLQEDRSIESMDSVLPSWIRIGVIDLDQSVEWLTKHLGMKITADHADQGYMLMSLKLNHLDGDSLWVIEQDAQASINKADSQVQPICWIQERDEFFRYHQFLIDSGVETSDIGGFVTRGMVSFHCYDPNGNRYNFSSM